MGQCIGLWELQALAIKIKQNFPVRVSYLLAVIFGGHSVVIPRIHRRPASRHLPQGARKASHHWSICENVQGHVHSTVSPGFNAVGAGSSMLLCCPYPGFNNSSLVCTYSCIGEAAMCVSISTGLKAPFWGFSFKHHSPAHKRTEQPHRLLVSDFRPDFKNHCIDLSCLAQ